MNSSEVRSSAPPALSAFPGTVLGMLFRSLGVLAVLAVPVLTGLASVDPGAPGERPDRDQPSVWKASYSERYPGCVPTVLWPADEKPVALLTKAADGRVARVALDEQRRPLSVVPGGARTIGACR